jgi:hypothetical protein
MTLYKVTRSVPIAGLSASHDAELGEECLLGTW